MQYNKQDNLLPWNSFYPKLQAFRNKNSYIFCGLLPFLMGFYQLLYFKELSLSSPCKLKCLRPSFCYPLGSFQHEMMLHSEMLQLFRFVEQIHSLLVFDVQVSTIALTAAEAALLTLIRDGTCSSVIGTIHHQESHSRLNQAVFIFFVLACHNRSLFPHQQRARER